MSRLLGCLVYKSNAMKVDVGGRTVFEGASSDRVGLVDPEVRNDPKLSAAYPCAIQMGHPLY